MKLSVSAKLVASAAALSLASTPALAEKASNLTYLNGSDADRIERNLRDRGFIFIDSNRNSSGYKYSYFWHDRDNDCVSVETRGGQVLTINDAEDRDCNQSGGGDAGAAVAVGVSAALIAGLIASRSHHRGEQDRNHNAEQRAEYDRGYTDGLHGAAYHNYNQAGEYSRGYQVGNDEREANTSHHHRRGGYEQVAQYQDLVGARAAGGMDELYRRGFRQVDSIDGGNTVYSIQWRPESRQCLQVTIADGHFYSVDDIQTHPNCR